MSVNNNAWAGFDKIFDDGIEATDSEFQKDVLRTSKNLWHCLGSLPNPNYPRAMKFKAGFISGVSHVVSAVKGLVKCSLPCCQNVREAPQPPHSPESTHA